MTISYISGAAAKSNVVSMSLHQTGDILLTFTFYNLLNSSPVVPTGWTSSTSTYTSSNGGCAAMIAYKYATSSSEVMPTWTSATGIILHVYRCGAGQTWLPPLGDLDIANGNVINWGLNANVSATRPGYSDESWYVRFAAHATATNLTGTTPSSWTARASVANQIRGIDSNSSVTVDSNSIGTPNSYTVNQTNNNCVATVRLAVLNTLSTAIPPKTIVAGVVDFTAPSGSQSMVCKVSGGIYTILAYTQPTVNYPSTALYLNPDGTILVGDYTGTALIGTDGSVNAVGFSSLGFYGDGVASAENAVSLYSTYTDYATPANIYKLKSGVQTTIALTGTTGTVKGIASVNDVVYVLVGDAGTNWNSVAQIDTSGNVSTTVWTSITKTAQEFTVRDNGNIYYYDNSDYKIYSLISGTKTALTIKGLDLVYGIAIDNTTGDLYVTGAYGSLPQLYFFSGGQQYSVDTGTPLFLGKLGLSEPEKKTGFFSMF